MQNTTCLDHLSEAFETLQTLQNVALKQAPMNAYGQSCADAIFEGCLKRFACFWKSKRVILKPRGTHFENIFTCSSNLEPIAQKIAQKCSQKLPKTLLWSSGNNWKRDPKPPSLKIPFLRQNPFGRFAVFEPRSWKMGPRLYIDTYSLGPLPPPHTPLYVNIYIYIYV